MGFKPMSCTSMHFFFSLFLVAGLCLVPELGLADFNSSLIGIKNSLTQVVLPTLSVIGIAIAAFSFFTGHPNSKQHMVYAIIGCIMGFGAEAIMNMIRSTVQ